MNRENLTRLGEELLREFEETEKTAVSGEFDRKCRKLLQPEKKPIAGQVMRWAARAAVLVFALIGVMTVAMLSVGPLRNHVLRIAAESYVPEETWTEFEQISYSRTNNESMAVYSDGKDNYQVLWSNEYGQRVYNFRSEGMGDTFFRNVVPKAE